MALSRLHIAVGVIFNETRDKVLLSKRPDNVPHGGLWEFPGGKLKPYEGVQAALARELFEELHLTVVNIRPLIIIDHDYPQQAITLDVWLVNEWHGKLTGREGQTIEWVAIHELSERQFPRANDPIIKSIQLPSLYLITPNLEQYGDDFLRRMRECIKVGVKLIQFRNRDIHNQKLHYLLRKILHICNEFGCQLLINGAATDTVRLGAHGVHLSSGNLLQLNERPLDKNYWVAASCHNQAELDHARSIEVDFVVISPVNRTRSHPEAKPIGWDKFGELARTASLPVYALGGMNSSDMITVRKHGGQGIAMISGIWSNINPASAVRKCLENDA